MLCLPIVGRQSVACIDEIDDDLCRSSLWIQLGNADETGRVTSRIVPFSHRRPRQADPCSAGDRVRTQEGLLPIGIANACEARCRCSVEMYIDDFCLLGILIVCRLDGERHSACRKGSPRCSLSVGEKGRSRWRLGRSDGFEYPRHSVSGKNRDLYDRTSVDDASLTGVTNLSSEALVFVLIDHRRQG